MPWIIAVLTVPSSMIRRVVQFLPTSWTLRILRWASHRWHRTSRTHTWTWHRTHTWTWHRTHTWNRSCHTHGDGAKRTRHGRWYSCHTRNSLPHDSYRTIFRDDFTEPTVS